MTTTLEESSWHNRISTEIDRCLERFDCKDAKDIRDKLEDLKKVAGQIAIHSASCRQCRKYFAKIDGLTSMLHDFNKEPDEYKDGYFNIIDEIASHLQKDHGYTLTNTYIRMCTIFGGLLGISIGCAIGQSIENLIIGSVVGCIVGLISGFSIGRILEKKIDSEGKLL
ncbi:hypothetical protein K9N50_02095 [bacterium]|nr:hypothetical protein [bacterium]